VERQKRESAATPSLQTTLLHLPGRPAEAVVQQGSAVHHPNEFDRHRIGAMLVHRRRYRYVQPTVVPESSGYRIESPCCSRNLEPDGGVIDIARLEFVIGRCWRLFRKEHQSGQWQLHGVYASLRAALAPVNADPKRLFWP